MTGLPRHVVSESQSIGALVDDSRYRTIADGGQRFDDKPPLDPSIANADAIVAFAIHADALVGLLRRVRFDVPRDRIRCRGREMSVRTAAYASWPD